MAFTKGHKVGHKHGMCGTPEYNAWTGIKERCYNKNCPRYPDYGGRGIRVHADWLADFRNFYKDMGPLPQPRFSLERIDNNKDYEPGNCRWASPVEQNRNRRSLVLNPDLVKQIREMPDDLSTAAVARRLGLPYHAVRFARIGKSWGDV